MALIRNINIEFGRKLKYLRKMKNISQEEMAFRCDINKNYYSDLERGKRNPTLTVIKKIADGFGVSIQRLFEGIGNL